jgi:hypothetical protein
MQSTWFAAMAIAAAALVASCQSAPATESGAAASADNSDKICKRMPVMGSNFPKTVCSSAEEWAAFEEQTRESVDAYDKDRKSGNTQGAFEN